MKNLIFSLLVVFAAGSVKAADFVVLDVNHPAFVTGAFTDLKGHSDAGGALALLTYGPIPGWVVFDLGGSLGRALGGPSVAFGGSYNLLPDVKATSLALLSVLYPDASKFANLKSILSSPVSTPDITMSFGPHYSYVFNDGLKGKGMITLFYGAAWNF
jgi:hypothetical protein